MRIYVAASWPRRAEAIRLAELLTRQGFTVTSRWHDGYPPYPPQAEQARQDMADIRGSEAVVCLTGDDLTSGGRHGEVGASIALGLHTYLLGPREKCVWHHHPAVMAFNDGESFLEYLAR
jgi:hypothetical protein